MECPKCGYARSASEKECPRCVYIANTIREHAQKRSEISPPAAPAAGPKGTTYCSACGHALEAGVRFCKDCGAPQQGATSSAAGSPSVRLPTISVTPAPVSVAALSANPQSAQPSETTPSPSTALISIMWTLTAVEIVLIGMIRLKPPTLFLLDLPACVMAIVLAASRNTINRWNGWAKLALEGIGLAIAVVVTMMQLKP
ncbi:MAG: Double zinc ribbon [Chthonomonadaceae bacterium]|nr:Double zinc ribbon [Chthonomonadaceae bacterium]